MALPFKSGPSQALTDGDTQRTYLVSHGKVEDLNKWINAASQLLGRFMLTFDKATDEETTLFEGKNKSFVEYKKYLYLSNEFIYPLFVKQR